VCEINSKILLLSRCFIFGGCQDLDKYIFFPWQMCFLGVILD